MQETERHIRQKQSRLLKGHTFTFLAAQKLGQPGSSKSQAPALWPQEGQRVSVCSWRCSVDSRVVDVPSTSLKTKKNPALVGLTWIVLVLFLCRRFCCILVLFPRPV